MTAPEDPLGATSAQIRFGIWSDNPAPADQLLHELRSRNQPVALLGAGLTTLVECLVVLMRSPLNEAGLARLTELANRARMTVAVEPPRDPRRAPPWPREVTLCWTGQGADLDRIAEGLIRLVSHTGLPFAPFPSLLGTERPLRQLPWASSRQSLVEQLRRPDLPRVIPIAQPLYDELVHTEKATGPIDYDLIRLARWTRNERRNTVINLRLGNKDDLNSSLTRPQSLEEVVLDKRTRRLIMVLGEPGAGKSLQLRYHDALAALRSIRRPGDPSAKGNSFYVALADQPASPDISFNWLAARWSDMVDTSQWCDLDQFVHDGGTVLLDGLNEGGIRTLQLTQWMVHWRDVIRDLLRRGASKVVVTCRTRDQVINMRAPENRDPTEVSLLPLSRDHIIAIATGHDVDTGARLHEALRSDGGLIELYSNPFRLASFLRSGAPQVADTETLLFGTAVSAAIVHEWEHDAAHGPLVPVGIPNRLKRIANSGADPWPVLESMPLIRALGGLARQLTLPAEPGGRARLTMSPRDGGMALSQALHDAGERAVDPALIVETAKDLHILADDPTKVRFAHPSMQHLFAALGTPIEDIVSLARQKLSVTPAQEHPLPDGQAPPASPVTAPGYAHHRYEELFKFAAQLRGVDVADRLADVDPVLAARVYLSIRSDTDAAVAARIRSAILRRLRDLTDRRQRSAMLAALGDMGWSLPSTEEGSGATVLVPAREWQLGDRRQEETDRRVGSEVRTISLPAFRIARFPVSNAEFELFIQSGGYEDPTLWSPEGWEWRMRRRAVDQFVSDWQRRQEKLKSEYPRMVLELLRSGAATPVGAAALVRFATMPEWEIAEHARTQLAQPVTKPKYWHETTLRNRLQPVVGVSWFEANAYCTWLGRLLRAAVRLPSENEWEAACLHSWQVRTTAGIEAVLGAGYANTKEFGYEATTPIGTFATREQERRLLPVELLGNVFEWTFDYYAAGVHNRRTLKGGSWQQELWRARPAYRGRGDVDNRNNDLGFRYVIPEEPA